MKYILSILLIILNLPNLSNANEKYDCDKIAKFYEIFLEPADFVNAYTWYSIEVAQGIKTAKTKRDELINELNEKDLLEAQTLSIKLFKQINN